MSNATAIYDPGIDPEKMMLDRVDMTDSPVYTVSEMAGFFFARTSHWVRWLEGQGAMSIEEDGKTRTVGVGRTSSGARKYTLADIEEITHALAQRGKIKGSQVRQTLTLVKIQAEMHGLI